MYYSVTDSGDSSLVYFTSPSLAFISLLVSFLSLSCCLPHIPQQVPACCAAKRKDSSRPLSSRSRTHFLLGRFPFLCTGGGCLTHSEVQLEQFPYLIRAGSPFGGAGRREGCECESQQMDCASQFTHIQPVTSTHNTSSDSLSY